MIETLQLQQQAQNALRNIFDDNRYLEILGGALLETRGVMKKLEDITIATFNRISRGDKAENIATRVAREIFEEELEHAEDCLLYTSPSPRDQRGSRMPSSA